MSNYRDDTLERLTVSDRVWAGVKNFTDDTLRLSIATAFTLMATTTEQLIASDAVIEGNSGFAVLEVLKIQDEAPGSRFVTGYTQEKLKAFDHSILMQSDQAHEQLTFSEQHQAFIRSAITEKLSLSESSQSQRYSSQFVYESLRLKDSTAVIYSNYVNEDPLSISDSESSRLSVNHRIVESLTFSDSDISSVATHNHVVETLKVTAAVSGTLYAINHIHEYLAAFDEMLPDQFSGQAWTANTDTWAVSRYHPYNFEGVSVINDQVYAWNDQGVFVVGIEGESIQSVLKTGKLDFGEVLVHPTAAFLEYQLSGNDKGVSVSVGTTQSGDSRKFTYLLPGEKADYLTNGRVVFGRGLHGRHFSFDLNIHGTSAQINSLSIEYAPTARRT